MILRQKPTNNQHSNRSALRLRHDDVIGLEFDSEVKAYNFYCRYALVKGYKVSLFDLRRNCKGYLMWRKYVCTLEMH